MKNFCPSIKMENLSLKELRLIAKDGNISGCKSMPKDKFLRIIDDDDDDDDNNNNSNNDEIWQGAQPCLMGR